MPTVDALDIFIRYANRCELFTSTLFTAHTFEGDMVGFRSGFGLAGHLSVLKYPYTYDYISVVVRLNLLFESISTKLFT